MEKTKLGVALGAAAVIALAGFSIYDSLFVPQMGYQRTAQITAPIDMLEPAPMTVDEEFQTLLPTLVSLDPNVRQAALGALAGALDRDAGKELSAEMREESALSVIELYDGEPGETAKSAAIKRQALGLVLTRLDTPAAHAFAAGILSSPDAQEKTAALQLLSSGWIKDETVRSAVYTAVHSSGVPQWLRPAVIRRSLGAAAENELMALMESTEDNRTLRHCAVEIQNLHRPHLLGPVLSRLEKAGMLADIKELPWFSGRLMAQHIEKADDDELLRALRVVWLRPTLTRSVMPAAQRRLAHADPGIRRLVARIIPDAVKHQGLELERGEEMLAARLQIETDPAVKGELEGSLTAVRETRRMTQTSDGQEQRP
ncbi:MAG: hypothetical protein ABIJ96_16615 [Elusimicrobiota bacterium]